MPPKEGEIIEGKVIKLSKSAIFLDLGAKGTGIIYGQEFLEAKGLLKDFKIGDNVWGKVVELDNEEGYIELSVAQAQKELIWQELEIKREKDETLKVKILGANKGGLLSEVSGIPAFLPVSQLSAKYYPKVEGGDKLKILRELQKFIGQELKTKIIDLDPKQKKLILSEKVRGEKEIKEILKNYQVGDVVEGKITGLADFGAFMSFPFKEKAEPIEGLIHISELDWQLIKDPSEIVKKGQTIKAKIIEISDNRVALSLKALKALKK